MKSQLQLSGFGIGLASFAGVGILALASVILPSPIRLEVYKSIEAASPILRYPESAPGLTSSDIDLVVEHPLFNADRQKDPAPPAQSTLPGLDTYRLAGVIVTAETSIAVVERVSAKTTVTLKVGDSLDGRIVKEIKPDGVLFSGLGKMEILSTPKIAGASFVTPAANGAQSNNSAQRMLGVGDRK